MPRIRLIPLNSYVLVDVPEETQRTSIVLPEDASPQKDIIGTVTSVGEDSGEISVGDVVMFKSEDEMIVSVDGDAEVSVVDKNKILLVLEVDKSA